MMTAANHRVRFGPAEWIAVVAVIASVVISAASVGWSLSADIAGIKTKLDATDATLSQIETVAQRKADDIAKLQQDVAALKVRAGLFGQRAEN